MKPILNNNFSIIKILPSLFTITSLLLGLFAIRIAIDNNPILAIYLILIAGIFDLLDGRIARLLKATSEFGGELDSLSDFTTFGVAPAFVLYYCMLYDSYPFGWISVCLFVVAALLRLARFNVLSKAPSNYSNYFMGIPVPAGAILLFVPFYLSIGLNITVSNIIVAIYCVIIALMMISTVPTISTKKLKLNKKLLPIAIAIITLFILLLIYYTWMILLISSITYMLSIPVTVIMCTFFDKKNS